MCDTFVKLEIPVTFFHGVLSSPFLTILSEAYRIDIQFSVCFKMFDSVYFRAYSLPNPRTDSTTLCIPGVDCNHIATPPNFPPY